jgi:hypothetical protein
MKITIEFEVENEHQAEGLRRRAEMLNSPDWIASWWHISDVLDLHRNWEEEDDYENELDDLTDEEAREVLRLADKYHDSEEGINWAVLRGWIDHVLGLRKEIA